MNVCRQCGAELPESARFCSTCGVPTRPGATREGTTLELAPKAAPERLDAQRRDESLGDATRDFLFALGASLLAVVVALGKLALRLVRPAARAAFQYIRARVSRALAPSSTWDPTWIPNFLYWGVFAAFLWRYPTSVVGIVYAALANDARAKGDYELARRRAEVAKNWLIADFILGVGATVFKKLVF